MKMTKKTQVSLVSVALASLFAATSVSALERPMMETQQAAKLQTEANVDYAAAELAAGNWDAAIKKLEAVDNEDPFRLLNLAAAYRKAGRTVEAKAVYNRVLAMKKNPYADLGRSVAPRRVKTLAKKAVTAMNDQ